MVRKLIFVAILVAAGWYGGAKWGAPAGLVDGIDGVAARAKDAALDGAGRQQDSQTEDKGDASRPATGDNPATDDAPADIAPESGAAGGDMASVAWTAGAEIADRLQGAMSSADGAPVLLCRMAVSNAPRSDGGVVATHADVVSVNGVGIRVAPVSKSCLSSGFGERSGRPHRGVDYYSDGGGEVFAAAPGEIVEAVFREDYGNMIVIRHTDKTYTRYAHLAAFDGRVAAGARVDGGDRLGLIGQTGSAGAPHLHFEILSGAYVSGVGHFGLTALDPFAPPGDG